MTIEEYNDIFSSPTVKELEITVEGENTTITNSLVLSEQMSLEESLCSDENLRYGACESSCFQIQVANISGVSYKNKWLDVNMDVEVNSLASDWIDDLENYIVTENDDIITFGEEGDTYTVSLGRFKVIEDKPTNDRNWRSLTCYDEMYDILNADVASWYSALTFPMTIKQFRDSFFTHLGITQETRTLVNDSFSTQGGFVVEGTLSGKTIIESICELNGVFGHINPNGKFDYIQLPSSDSIELNWYINQNGSYEDYVTDAITGIVARSEELDVGTTVGTSTNQYVIENNPLIFGTEGTSALTTALTNLLGVISQVTYRPFKVETYGNPMLPVGTGITVKTRNQTINSIVVSKYMTGIQALKDSITATGDKTVPSGVNNVQSEISRTKGKVHVLEVTADKFRSEINSIEKVGGFIYDIKSYSASDNILTLKIQAGDTFKALENNEVVSLGVRFTSNITGYDSYTKRLEISYGTPTTTLTVPIKYDTSNLTNQVSLYKNQILYLKLSRSGSGAYTCVVTTDTFSTSLIEQTADQIKLEVSETAQTIVDNTVPIFKITSEEYSGTGNANKVWVIEYPLGFTYSDVQHYGFRFGIKAPGYIQLDADKPKYLKFVFENNYILEPIFIDNTVVTTQLSSQDVVYLIHDSRTVDSSTYTGFHAMTDKYSQAQIDVTKNQIVLKIDNSGKIVEVALSADPSTGTEFKVDADNINLSASDVITLMAGGTITLGGQSGIIISGTNFSVDASGNVTLTGQITATSGQIGGWTIGTNKIYAGDSTTGVAAVQKPTANTTWVFGAGGTSHSSYADCPFKVSKAGSVFAKYININKGNDAQSGAAGTAYLGWDTTNNYSIFQMYDSSGSKTLDISADTGSIKTTGDIHMESRYIHWVNAVNDWATIRAGAYGGTANQGYLNIATGDDGTEEIIVTQNTGTYYSNTEVRRATLLSDTGKTQFPSSVTATSFINGSSKKIKKNIEDIDLDEAKKILQLRPVKFDFKSDDTDNQHERGFIAEEVEKIYPNLISEELGTEGKPDFVPKSLNYIGMIPYLVKMIQNQQEEINELKTMLNNLNRKDG